MSRKKDEYEQVYDNEPFEWPLNKPWHLACCHCGLVHDVKVEVVDENGVPYSPRKDRFRMTVRQNATRTKRLRKADSSFECKPVPKPRRKRQ